MGNYYTYNISYILSLKRSNPELIIALVNEGMLDPIGESKSKWRFSFSTVENVLKVVRFHKDLNLNLAGAAIALELLDRIEELESMVERI